MARPRRRNRQATLIGAGVAGAAGASGLLALLRGRRERRLKAATEALEAVVLPPGQTGEPDIVLTEPGPGHAGGHQHLAPPPEQPAPAAEAHAEHGYRSGHRDRGGRSIAFRTKRGR